MVNTETLFAFARSQYVRLFDRVAFLLRHAFWRHLCHRCATRAVRLFTQYEDILRLLSRYTALYRQWEVSGVLCVFYNY